jgi:2-C-methyl-D-erythritol 4-phosphate cytidylyltransferase
VETQIQSLPYREKLILETGGPERQDSVYHGLCRLSDQVEIVLVHDAARPFVSAPLVGRIIEGARRYRACIPALPVGETVKEVQRGQVVQTLDRRDLLIAQTPQGFEADLLRKAFEQARKEAFLGTDESMLVERLGLSVHVVEGEPENRKITWKEDLA